MRVLNDFRDVNWEFSDTGAAIFLYNPALGWMNWVTHDWHQKLGFESRFGFN
jgi:hypothetical protein